MAQQGAAAKKDTGETFAYDEVMYESYCYPQTHPTQMYVIGTLFGLTPPDFKKARVLELGCAAGGNLFPLAQAWPEATFHGIDLSAQQIEQAQLQLKELGLKNLSFAQEDISKFDMKGNKGKFDYIICHGIFSWVPDFVRDAIFKLCNECLSEDGMAVISYNALPGWNAVRSLREMMIFHTQRFSTPAEKVGQARALLNFLLESVPESRASYRGIIEEELKMLAGTNDSYLFHDHMEGNNTQFYLNEFAAEAMKNGLSYVGDASISSMYIGNLPDKARDTLKALDNVVMQEQYIDFILNRRFRTSILCKKPEKLNRNLRAEQVMDYYLSTPMRPATPGADPKGDVVFSMQGGPQFTTHGEVAGRLYMELAAAGNKPIAANELVDNTVKKLSGVAREAVVAVLQQNALELVLRGMLVLSAHSPDYAMTISEKPAVFPLVRLQAKSGAKSVTNAFGTMVATDMLGNMVMERMDGKNTISAITDAIVAKVKDGTLNVTIEGKQASDEKTIRSEVEKNVNTMIQRMADQALLMA